MQARLLAFLLWAAVAATLVFWALRLGARAPAVPAQAVAVSTAAGARGDLGRLLGQPAAQSEEQPQAPPEAGRFQLVGVVAPRGDAGTREGLALIAVDGKPARTYRVGAPLDERWVLQSVRTRAAVLGPRSGNGHIELELPPPPVASTGVLPAAGSEQPLAAPPAAGRQPQGSVPAPHSLPPGQAPQGQAPQGRARQQQMPSQDMAPQEMPVPQQEVEPPPAAEPGQGS
jgi:general secretion pathway protein C